MEPFFEQQPWLLIPVVIAIVETWNLAKASALRWWHRRHPADDPTSPA